MSNELPHAALRCTACGTGFSVKLKKGRVPTKPIPCPRCRAPIMVTEADIVDPGAKKGGSKAAVPSLLEKTKLVAVDEGELLAAAAAAAAEPLTQDELLVDPPTAEAKADAPAAPTRETPKSGTAGFGIVQRRKLGAPKEARDTSGDLSLTVGAPGVHVVRGEGRGKRDNVYGERAANSMAIGRIATKRVASNELGRRVIADDPDLPAAVSAPAAEEDEIRFLDVSSEASEAFVEVAPEPLDEGSEGLPEVAAEALSESSEGLIEAELEPASEGSEGLIEAELEPASEGSEGLLELEPEPVDLPAPKADLPGRKIGLTLPKLGLPLPKPAEVEPVAEISFEPSEPEPDLPTAKADLRAGTPGIPAPARPGIPSPRLDLSRLREAAAGATMRSSTPAKVEAGSGRARLPSLFDLELPLDEIVSEASEAIQAGLESASSAAAAVDISFDPVIDGPTAPADREAFVSDLALEMKDERARDASILTAPNPPTPAEAAPIADDLTVLGLQQDEQTLLVDAQSVAAADHMAHALDEGLPWREEEADEAAFELPELPAPTDEPFAESLRTNLSDDQTRMTTPDELPEPVAPGKSRKPIAIIVVVLVVIVVAIVVAITMT